MIDTVGIAIDLTRCMDKSVGSRHSGVSTLRPAGVACYAPTSAGTPTRQNFADSPPSTRISVAVTYFASSDAK